MPGTPPPHATAATMYWQLLSLDIPASLAREAAHLHPNDLNAALDWACSSQRRHVRLAAAPIEVVASPSDAGPPAIRHLNPQSAPLSNLPVPAAPASRMSPVPALESADGDVDLSTAPAVPDGQPAGSLLGSPSRMGGPCYIDGPAAEVHAWVCMLANSQGAAVVDSEFLPLYSQCIREHSLHEIVARSLATIQSLRGLDLSIEQAAKLPRCLGRTTLLPLAVAVAFLHEGCGFPAVFEVALYPAKSQTFTCKARWWACPTGDPNAGKSPACNFVMQASLFQDDEIPACSLC